MSVAKYGDVTLREKKRAVAQRILEARWKYTAREWGIVQLYFTCGLSQNEIARIFGVARPSISRSMHSVRRKALG